MTDDGSTPRRAWRPDAMLLCGVLLVLLQTGVRAAVVLPSYYWQDDFIHMEAAGRLGLTREFVVRDHNGHLEMGTNLVYWLLGRDAGPSFLPAALLLLAMQVVASCLLLSVLRQLFGRSPWLLVPFAGYLLTPLGLPAATWWAAGMQALPLQIAMLTAVGALVRAVRTRSWRWTAVSVAGTATGLFFWQKAVLVLPVLLGVLLLVEWAGEPPGRRLQLLAASWPRLLPHVLVVAAYLPLYVAVSSPAQVVDPDAGRVLSGTGDTVLRMLLPGLLGGPWTGRGAENTLFPDVGDGVAALAAALTLAIVAGSVWLRGARALQGWLLVAGYVAVDVALLQLGRADFLDITARDPRYITDALPVVAIGVCAAFSGPRRERRAPARIPRTLPAGAAALAVGVLAAGCLLSTSFVAGELQHRQSRAYVDAVVRAMDEHPDVSVVSTALPGQVVMARYPDVAGLLRAVGEDRPFDRPGTDLRVFDERGELRPVVLLEPALERSGPVAGCGWPLAGTWQPVGELAVDSPHPQVLRLRYATAQAATLHVSVGGRDQELRLPAGAGQAGFVVTGERGPVELRATGAPPGSVCADGVVVGVPWPEGVS
ncbi:MULTISPECIES: hypothetical protein [unclassified Blastococcus]